jgi:hypothetical protein
MFPFFITGIKYLNLNGFIKKRGAVSSQSQRFKDPHLLMASWLAEFPGGTGNPSCGK